jgi:hypothetical protein
MSTAKQSRRVAWLLVTPLVLVNAAAVWGQAGWAQRHIVDASWDLWVQWTIAGLFAVAVESVGVFLAGMAHAALMADQSAGLLRAGSYAVGLLVGLLNYWHFAGDAFAPTAQAVAFGALSSISPWLWSIYSRYRNRDRLAELGQVDKRAVKLSTARKFWHPVKSVKVIRYASWVGIVEPDEAVRAWEASAAIPTDQVSAMPARTATREATRSDLVATRSAPTDPGPFVAEYVPSPWVHPTAVEADQTADQGDQTEERPRPDEDLVAEFGDQIRSGPLTRYRVEKITGASRRQADRLIAALADQQRPATDQEAVERDQVLPSGGVAMARLSINGRRKSDPEPAESGT